MNLDVTFEDQPAEELLATLQFGDTVSASRLLAALDGESGSVLEDMFAALQEREINLDIFDLPRYTADSELAVQLRREEQLSQTEDLISQLSDTDPLRMYLEELAMIPAFGDINVLAEELKNANADEAVFTQVLNLFLSRVVELARSFTGHGVLLMDLIQEGSMGLWEQLPCYESGDLTEYCDHWVRWSMAKAVVRQAYATGTGSKLRQAMEDYRAVDERLLTELGRNPTTEEIAEAMHITVSEAEAVAAMLENMQMLRRIKEPEKEGIPEEDDQAVEDTSYFRMRQRISELLSALEPQQVQLLNLRYGLEGGMPMKPEQVAQKLGMTVEQVVAAEAAALSKLRTEN